MPKGQYTRKPKAPGQIEGRAEHMVDLRSVEPTGGVVIGDTVHQPLAEKTFVEGPAEAAAPGPVHWNLPPEVEWVTVPKGAELLHASPVAPVTPGPSFDAWLDEDAASIPANDRVSQMVQEWAAGFIPVEHSVSWLPAEDGKALNVLLTTAHGTSELVADAGAWTEADVSAALAVMRDELKV